MAISQTVSGILGDNPASVFLIYAIDFLASSAFLALMRKLGAAVVAPSMRAVYARVR
jgi:hypothetical protein